MDINDIFKESVTNTTISSGKRRLGPTPSLKKLKEEGYGISKTTVEDVDDEHGQPPNKQRRVNESSPNNSNSDSVDDEEGRFFDDGLTTQEKGILSWVDNIEGVDETLDTASMQRLVLRLERAVSKNTEQRLKHANDPLKFSESEADLDEAIQRLMLFANDVRKLDMLEESGTVETLVGLMAHENADIALDVIQVVSELSSEDSWSNDESEEEQVAVVKFLKSLLGLGFFDVLGDNLRRLNEDPDSPEAEADRQGVFQTLGLVENIVSLDIELANSAVDKMKLLPWLKTRILKAYIGKDDGNAADSNQQYAAEVLSILLQASTELQRTSSSILIDPLLRALSRFRKRTPTDDIEIEYLENIVDCICMLLTTAQGKREFIECEGVELLVLLQKQQQLATLLSFKILDYAFSPPTEDTDDMDKEKDQKQAEARLISQRYIDGLGLKYIFPIFMRRGKANMQKLYKQHSDFEERVINCISWLFRLAEVNTPKHWRVLAKFVPSPEDSESWKKRVDRLVDLNVEFYERVNAVEELLNVDSDQMSEEDSHLQRLDSGLFALQMTDIILAFICVENADACARIEGRLKRKGRDFGLVENELVEYVSLKQETTLSLPKSPDDIDAESIKGTAIARLQKLLPSL